MQCKKVSEVKLTKDRKSLSHRISHLTMFTFTNENLAINLVTMLVQGTKQSSLHFKRMKMQSIKAMLIVT